MERSKKMIVYKTLDEIKKIKKANEIIARLFEDVLPKHVKAGVSTYELDQIAEDYIRSQGAIPGTKGYDVGRPYPPYPAATCISTPAPNTKKAPSARKGALNDGQTPLQAPIISQDIPAGIGTVLLSQGLPRLHRAFPSAALDDVASPIRLWCV